MYSTRSLSKKAPATDPATLVLCGHGTRGTGGVLDRHAAIIRERDAFADVQVCSLYGRPDLAATLDGIAATNIRIVPWLMCAGFTMDRLQSEIDRHDAVDRVALAEPVGEPAAIADLAASVAFETCCKQGWLPRDTGLLLIGHGSGRNPVSSETTRRHAAHISATGRFAAVETAFLDEPPSPRQALDQMRTENCIAVGLFAERSVHGEADVPRLLGDTRSIVYTGPIGAEPEFVEIILAAARRAKPHRQRDAA